MGRALRSPERRQPQRSPRGAAINPFSLIAGRAKGSGGLIPSNFDLLFIYFFPRLFLFFAASIPACPEQPRCCVPGSPPGCHHGTGRGLLDERCPSKFALSCTHVQGFPQFLMPRGGWGSALPPLFTLLLCPAPAWGRGHGSVCAVPASLPPPRVVKCTGHCSQNGVERVKIANTGSKPRAWCWDTSLLVPSMSILWAGITSSARSISRSRGLGAPSPAVVKFVAKEKPSDGLGLGLSKGLALVLAFSILKTVQGPIPVCCGAE